MSPPRILIVEDEPDIVFSLQEDLRRQGYETGVATDGHTAIQMSQQGRWDLILLDVMLPLVDGFEVCRSLRRNGVATPVIFLTARTREADKEYGLDVGADDYITKPFSLRELRARIRARLRRASDTSATKYRFGECELDPERADLRRQGQRIEITAQEFRLLQMFVRNTGRVLSRGQIIDAAWGPGMAITDRAVDTHIFNLRKKIEVDASAPRVLVSVRGLGYRFDP